MRKLVDVNHYTVLSQKSFCCYFLGDGLDMIVKLSAVVFIVFQKNNLSQRVTLCT